MPQVHVLLEEVEGEDTDDCQRDYQRHEPPEEQSQPDSLHHVNTSQGYLPIRPLIGLVDLLLDVHIVTLVDSPPLESLDRFEPVHEQNSEVGHKHVDDHDGDHVFG